MMDEKTRKDFIVALRNLAMQLEAGGLGNGWASFTSLVHSVPVRKPEFGDMIVDQKYTGTTLVITTKELTNRQLQDIRGVVEGTLSSGTLRAKV